MRRIERLLVMVLLLAAFGGWNVPASATHLPTLLAENGIDPVTDGEWVVWMSDPLSARSPIKATRIATGETITVADQLVAPGGYDIDNGIVVWSEPIPGCQNQIGQTCNQNIYARDMVSGAVTTVAATGDVEEYPLISESLVLWNAWDGESWHVRVRDIKTMSEPTTIHSENLSEVVERYIFPVLSGPYVAWATYWENDDPHTSSGWRIWLDNLDTDGPPQRVAQVTGLLDAFDLAGNTLVYAAEDVGVVALDVTTQHETRITADAIDITTDGRYIVWAALDGEIGERTGLWSYDLDSGAAFSIPTGSRFDQHTDLAGGWLAWEGSGLPFPDSQYLHFVHAAPLTDLLPSGRRPVPDVTIPEVVYYPETGHYLGGQFQMYWERNGGLPVFGYPMTEAYEERSRDTGQTHLVQFFERQRFERHAENAGTPYEVLLGRLGYEDALAKGLLDTPGFQPILHDIVRGDCVWFGETRQMACTDFINYWRNHGLDLGDEGVSFRESLALFGYPISRAYIDQDTGLLTQYFERAVFELHPDNPDPYRVLLRRLGADVLDERGW